MRFNRKQSPAALRQAERRQREDEAPRLAQELPELASLSLEIEEKTEGTAAPAPKHVKRVVVASAPALFLVPCGDPRCDGGGHDVTGTVMRALRARQTRFQGEDACRGSLQNGYCRRVLVFEGFAEYGA